MIKKRIYLLILVLAFIVIISTGTVNAATTYNCTNCSNCTDTIAAAGIGDTIQLNQSILNYTGGTCIDFAGADNVTFDCLNFGNYIEGDDTLLTYGIRLQTYSDNNTIRNCNISKFYGGIYFADSDNNNVTNTITNFNSNGIYIWVSVNNTLTNITTQENTYDFLIYASSDSECNNNLTDITGSGNRPIEFYNYSATVEDKILSELILCNADNSTVNNVTIRGSDTIKNNMFHLTRTENSNISDINSSENYIGIRMAYSSNNNTLTDIVTNNNENTGILLYQFALNNTLTNITTNNNGNIGISCFLSNFSTITNVTANYNNYSIRFTYSSHSTLTNITSKHNLDEGISFYFDSIYNIVNNSHIENSTYGLYFLNSSTKYPEYNQIYNNYFNNTNNYYNSTNLTNYFNTTNTSGTNIIGGGYIGGNFWAYLNGTGFSETCTDSDDDGFCDLNYSLDGDNYDYLPLAGGGVCAESWSCTSWSVCSGGTQTRTCTDANSCGTTTSRPALSQSCTVEPGGGGGITKDQPTEAQTWTEITPDQPAEMTIDDPEIDLTKITITTTETVSGASLRVTKIDVVPLADLKIGMAGDTYQSFKIETTGINDENIESAIIEFKVNKTWVDEQGGSAGGIILYRGGEKVNVWNELQTTLIDSDSDYYYFSAISTGFSIFVVVIDLSACNNNGICETELGEDKSNCPKDCGVEKKGFFETIKSYLWTGIILVLVIAMVLVILIVRLKKGKRNKRLRQIMAK